MAAIPVSQVEAERDLHSLLSRIDENTSFVIVRDAHPVAVLQAFPRRSSLAERIAKLPLQTEARMDAEFAADVQSGIDGHRTPLDEKLWDD